MKSLLMNIHEHIEQYIRMTTAVLEMRVDVVDENLIRVAGTGGFNSQIGKRVRFGHIFKRIIERGEQLFIGNPYECEYCRDCENLGICGLSARLYCPIIADGKIIGAITLNSNSEKQKTEMLNNTERYREYIQSMADLIALKAKEYLAESAQKYNLELQQKLMNLIGEGVMILSSRRQILYMNERCEYTLGCNMRQIAYLEKHHMFSIHQESSRIKEKMTYRVKVRDRTISLDGKTYCINNEESDGFNIVFIFTDIQSSRGELAHKQQVSLMLSDLTGKSEAFNNMIEQCRRAAYGDTPILLAGESGTGKEILAGAIHNEGIYRNGLFLSVSNGADLQDILEKKLSDDDSEKDDSVLFGNTIYVDEVLNLDWEDQNRLLYIVNHCGQLRTQVICSTKSDLKEQMMLGNFNPDLYYALELFTIDIPPLRKRGDDIVLLVEEFLKEANKKQGRQVSISKELWQLIRSYTWKGNTKELQNFINYIVERADYETGEATCGNIPTFLLQKLQSSHNEVYELAENEKQLIIRALNDLESRGYTKQQIARELGIGTATLYRKMKEYQIQINTVYE